MLIYISGPITGHQDLNRPAFTDAARLLTEAGHEPVNPHDVKLDHTPTDPEELWRAYMRADLVLMLGCDGVALLDGWCDSRGARIERKLALDLGKPVRPLEGWLS